MKKIIITVILILFAGAIIVFFKNTTFMFFGNTTIVHNAVPSVSQYIDEKTLMHETSVTNYENTMVDLQMKPNDNAMSKTQDVQINSSAIETASTNIIAEMAYINIALAKLKELNAPVEDRTPNVTIQDDNTIIVTFPPPNTFMLAGDFIIQINKESREIIDIKIWR